MIELYRNTKCKYISYGSLVYGRVATSRYLQRGAYWLETKVRIQPYIYPLGSNWTLTPVPNYTGIHDATT